MFFFLLKAKPGVQPGPINVFLRCKQAHQEDTNELETLPVSRFLRKPLSGVDLDQ